jgi:hypothetical protein
VVNEDVKQKLTFNRFSVNKAPTAMQKENKRGLKAEIHRTVSKHHRHPGETSLVKSWRSGKKEKAFNKCGIYKESISFFLLSFITE